MIIVQWGQPTALIRLQWALLAEPTVVEEQENTPNPIAVIIATSGTAAPVNWTENTW